MTQLKQASCYRQNLVAPLAKYLCRISLFGPNNCPLCLCVYNSDTDTTPTDITDSCVQRLQRFGTYGQLKQAALRKIIEYASEETDLMTGKLPLIHLILSP